jgi:hypothetical protein
LPGWGKLIAGAVLGAAGTLYATNEEFRKALPERARDLPVAVRRRFEAAAAAAREASALRRAEILRELEAHGGGGDVSGRSAPEARPTSLEAPVPQLAEEPAVRREDA